MRCRVSRFIFWFLAGFLFLLSSEVWSQPSLNDALNVAGGTLEFTTYSIPAGYPWQVDEGESFQDGACARSGAVASGVSSYEPSGSILETTFSGNGVFCFRVKRQGSCYLRLFIDDVYYTTYFYSSTDLVDWELLSCALFLDKSSTVQICFQNGAYQSPAGEPEPYLLLDEVRWIPAEDDGFAFVLNDDGNSYTLQHYFGNQANVVVPALHNGKPITKVADEAFWLQEDLISVVLPEGLLHLGDHSFGYCTNLQTVVLPSTLKTIDRMAFVECTSLQQIDLPDGLTEIGVTAFSGCAFTQLQLPISLTTIRVNVFADCKNLTEITIPANITTIEEGAFGYCGLRRIIFADRNGADITLEEECFISNLFLQELVLPEGITSLPGFMLSRYWNQDTWNMASVRIPASVTYIGEDAFTTCYGLTFFFMGPPPTVAKQSLNRQGRWSNSKVVYQKQYQSEWEAILDQYGQFCNLPASVLSGEPLPPPTITSVNGKRSFFDSMEVTFTLVNPLPGDCLQVGLNNIATILTPGESDEHFTYVAPNTWKCLLTNTTQTFATALRPVAGTRSALGEYEQCSGVARASFQRWNEFADALDNRQLDFFITSPDYWHVSNDPAQVGGSSLGSTMMTTVEGYPWHHCLQTQLQGPGLVSFWYRRSHIYTWINFGPLAHEIDPANEYAFSYNYYRFPAEVTGYDHPVDTWIRSAVHIPAGSFTVG